MGTSRCFEDRKLPRVRLRLCLAFGALLALQSGCVLHKSTMATVPREWRDTNPWGPEALAARARGELKPLFYSDQMAEWAAFARETLQDGDILFRYGKSAGLNDRFVNGVLTGISDSK